MILIEPIRNGKYIKDGAYWLAIQIWAQKHLKLNDTIVFPTVADPHIQLGYFQNAEVEVNHQFLKSRNIEIVRRDTGGGAIYIDSNAVNVCFLIPYDPKNNILGNYQKFYEPAIAVLKDLGAKDVIQSGKNDLTIDKRKVSGAAMMLIDDIIYGGFSLLYKVDYDSMVQALNPNRKKIASKGVQSVRQRVGQLSEYFDKEYQNLDIFEFKDLFIKKFFKVDSLDQIKRYYLSDEEWAQIDELVNTKYKNWDWTYGKSPRYEYNRDARLPIGTINFSLAVEEGKIAKCKISGDFFAKKDIGELEASLLGTKMRFEDLVVAFKKAKLNDYFFVALDEEEIARIILDINKYEPLLEPIKVKNTMLANRFVLCPMTLSQTTSDGKVTDEELEYAKRRAASAPLHITGGAYFDDFGQLFEYGFSAKSDEDIAGLKKLADVTKSKGATAILQLAHAGKFSKATLKKYKYVYGPSYEKLNSPFEHEVKELSVAQIKQIVEDYGKATYRAIKAGFNGIEISMAQRLLLQTFISKIINKRQDEYGCQSFESRTKLLFEVVAKIQEVINKYAPKDFIFGFRATPEETVGDQIGYTIEEFNQIMDLLISKFDLSYLAIASWGHDIYLNKVRSSEKYKGQLINKVVYDHINKRIPVIASGGINTPDKCLEALKHADLVGLSAIFVVEPDFVSKIEKNEADTINLNLNEERLNDLAIPKSAFKDVVNMFDFCETISNDAREILNKNAIKK